jgi:signal transduction histidine kinase
MDNVKEFLNRSDLFQKLDDEQLDRILKFCHEESYEPGETIFAKGDEAADVYIVVKGRVALEVQLRLGSGPGRTGTVDVITTGGTFGGSAICGGQTSAGAARCIEQTKLLVFGGQELLNYFDEDPRAGYFVMQRLANIMRTRLQHTGNMMAHVLSIASHDLKAPLAAVESYHKVILDGYAGDTTEKQRNMLVRSSERINGLLNLIDNILDISRIDTREIKMEPTSILEVIEHPIEVAQTLAKDKGVEFDIIAPQKLPSIEGSAERLQQVFTNLLGNAVKFTPSGGTVSIKLQDKEDHILIEVMDTGVGIPSDELPRIFDDFYRGIRLDAAGAGLGLSISKRIIEAHQGKIWVESPSPESGVGSKFTFTLPKDMVKS